MDEEEAVNKDRVDDLLRKITASGLSSLSEDELAELNRASFALRAKPAVSTALVLVGDEDYPVTRQEAAQAHVEALARGIDPKEVIELWVATGYVFGNGQPLKSEVRQFKELAARVTCSRCDREAERFFPSNAGSVCPNCRDSPCDESSL